MSFEIPQQTKTCPTCSSTFTLSIQDKDRYCSPACRPSTKKQYPKTEYRKTENESRKRARKEALTNFVAIDGEAVWTGKPYESEFVYCMLSVGNRTIQTDGTKDLTLTEILRFCYQCFLEDDVKSKTAYVGFFLGFDFTHWFKQLPEERARMLFMPDGIAKRQRKADAAKHLGPFPVEWKDDNGNVWEIDTLGLKRVKFRPKPKKGESSKWMNILDAGSFFQTSLLNAAKPTTWPKGVISESDYALIEEGKSGRGTDKLDSRMISYNLAENRTLSAMMSEYEKGLKHIQIALKKTQWFGPGQCSSQWLKNIECVTNEQIQLGLEKSLLQAAQGSYYGGRFEVFQHGHIPGDTYEYDINSAYPTAMRDLPNILEGTWKNKRYSTGLRKQLPATPIGGLVLCRGKFYHDQRILIGGLPWRNAKGGIQYPRGTEGWYWLSEIQAAMDAECINTFDIRETWTFTPDDINSKPLASIESLYQERLSVGKDSPEGKALKLVYNSAYGKMAQSIGMPKHSNPIYASLITSHCRTTILKAIASHPDGQNGVVMIATDGIYFRSPHPHLSLGKGLGQWDFSVKKNLTTFMPGIYWDDKSRENLNNPERVKIKSRGISGADLAKNIATLDEKFRNIEATGEFPTLDIPIRFTYLSIKQGLIGQKEVFDLDGDKVKSSRWDEVGKPLSGQVKTINASPRLKRDMRHRDTHSDTIRYYAYDHVQETTGYDKTFGMELSLDQELANMESRDSESIQKELIEILHSE